MKKIFTILFLCCLTVMFLHAQTGSIPSGDAQSCPGTPTITDYDGNVYSTVRIGNQCWMKENLRTTHYANGTSIALTSSGTSSTTPYRYVPKIDTMIMVIDTVYYYDTLQGSYTFFNYDSVDAVSYLGYFYNWAAVMNGASSSSSNPSGVQGICPNGWHVPSQAEWNQLVNYVSGQSAYSCSGNSNKIAKALASTTDWEYSTVSCAVGNNRYSNNTTGFDALPAGNFVGSTSVTFGDLTGFWSSTLSSSNSSLAYNLYFRNYEYAINLYSLYKYHAYSVRCLRNQAFVPTVSKGSVLDIKNTTATYNGNVTNDGGASVTARGVCWSTSSNPTIADAHTSNGTGTGTFTSNITGLLPNTTYYVRAYATNSSGTAYSTVTSFRTLTACNGVPTVTDIDGNVYNTVKIGNQCWMRENMKTTRYSDGTTVSPNNWYYPNGDSTNMATYGLLYNWTATIRGWTSVETNPSGVQGICPIGWHVPSYAEWTQLTNYLSSESAYWSGGNSNYIAKALSSTTGWTTSSSSNTISNNLSANNRTGFGAYPAGFYIFGDYYLWGMETRFWSTTCEGDTSQHNAYYRQLYYSGSTVNSGYSTSAYAYSVRCLRDPIPVVTTKPVYGYTIYTATGGGEVVDDGGATVTARGLCWSTEHNPTIADGYMNSGSGTGEFSTYIGVLQPGTKYYVRAYATNSYGTSYGNEVFFFTEKTSCPGVSTVTDHEGNVYNTVKIGNQCWMKENLRTTTSPSTGTYLIPPFGTDYTYTGKQAFWYNNDSVTYAPLKYGLLYNWNAAVDTFNVAYGETSVNTNSNYDVSLNITGRRQGICPKGWHLPNQDDWLQLTDYIDSQSECQCSGIAKALASTSGWSTSLNYCAVGNDQSTNNASGFGAMPTGNCYGSIFQNVGELTSFWSSAEPYGNNPLVWSISFNHSYVSYGYSGKSHGRPVRCLLDPGATVTTGDVLGFTTTTATCGGEVVDDLGSAVTARGVCWSTSHNPTIADAHTNNGSGIGTFTSNLTGLTPGTGYYVRAYATNSEGTTYGAEKSFFTACPPEDQCELTFVLTDSYGDGWNGNAIQVTDAETGIVLATMTNEDLDSLGYYTEETQTLSLAICDGKTINFEWVNGFWENETSYTVYGIHGEEIFSGSGGFSNDTVNNYTYTVNCCDKIILDEQDTYTEDFESYTTSTTAATGVEPTCWKLVRADAAMPDDKRPQLFYNNAYTHSGNYSLRLANKGVYAMPKLELGIPINEMRLEMYLRQPNSRYQLEVGVWEPSGTFVLMASFSSDNQEIHKVTCDFSSYTGTGGRIAFRNTVNDGSNIAYSTNYIDDITLRRIPVNDAKPCPGVPTVTDIDGNVYNTVQIGEQCWMKENLRTTHFADGMEIPLTTYASSSYEPYCYSPNNDPNIVAEYGYLYNQIAAMHGANHSDANPSGMQGICPAGWHLPSSAEWTQLSDYVGSQTAYGCNGYSTSARALAAATGWAYDESVNNECGPAYNQSSNGITGFNALPAGYFYNNNRYFGYRAYFWTTSEFSYYNNSSRHYYLSGNSSNVSPSYEYNYYAMSVRCVLGEGGNVPVVTIGKIRVAGDSTMTCEGMVTADGGEDIIARGICWSTSSYFTPSITGSHTEDGTGLGTFTGTLTSLTPGTKYYVRAYATNATGTAYSEQTFFIMPNCRPIYYLPYTENFDRYTPSTIPATDVEPNCWELVKADVAMTDAKRPQLYYNSDFAHSGSYSLKLNNRGVYAMPELSENIKVREVMLEMYLRQPNAAYQLEVGVWEPNGNFVPVKRFNNSTTDVEFVECNFSDYMGTGGRIAFRNVLANGVNYPYSVNYLDDIRLTDACQGIMLPYTENFEGHTTSTTAATDVEPLCWSLVQEDVPMTDAKRPQLYYNSNFAHSGNYSLKLYNRGIYAMPYLSWDMEEIMLNQVKLEMYVRQPNAAYQLEVGVWDVEEGFVPVQRINNSTTEIEHVTVDFSDYDGWGRQIAFRNVLANGVNYTYSVNYIDDITLTMKENCSITLPYTETFEDYTTETTTATGVQPTCWELVREDATMTDANRPQLYYRSDFAHSGNYSLKLYNRGIYAMPELELDDETSINQVKLEMYLRQANAAYQLQVGVWDGQMFEPVATFNNSTTNVEFVTCDFSNYTGNGNRIAFRNVLGSGTYAYSVNYLDDISLTVMVPCSITLPYTETFEDYTNSTASATDVQPDCWELVRIDAPSMPDDKRPQIYYNSNFAHSGDYSLKLYNRGVYAMPELDEEMDIPINRVKLEMYLRQANAAYQLEVGVWDDATGTFEMVKRFNNATTNVEFVTCDFSGYTGNGRRIAFRNVLGSGSYAYSVNYLDDITLTEMEDCTLYLPYTETFENFTTETTAATGVQPDCWEVVRIDAPSMPDDKLPQIYYNSNFAHSGDYTLKLGNRCVYAMPELGPNIPINQISLEMYLRQPNAAYRLEVGVWDDATSTFERVKLFNNSTTAVEHVTCDFSNYTGNGRRIAFRNTLGSGSYAYSYNYLDDITLTRVTNKNAEVANANTNDAGMLGADREEVDITVYPNPTRDYVNVQCTMYNVQCSGIEVIDVYGKAVRTVVGVNNDSPTQINVSGLAAGMYFVRVTTDKGVVTKPFVKR